MTSRVSRCSSEQTLVRLLCQSRWQDTHSCVDERFAVLVHSLTFLLSVHPQSRNLSCFTAQTPNDTVKQYCTRSLYQHTSRKSPCHPTSSSLHTTTYTLPYFYRSIQGFNSDILILGNIHLLSPSATSHHLTHSIHQSTYLTYLLNRSYHVLQQTYLQTCTCIEEIHLTYPNPPSHSSLSVLFYHPSNTLSTRSTVNRSIPTQYSRTHPLIPPGSGYPECRIDFEGALEGCGS